VEREIVLLGDIRKMYNSIYIEKVEQHRHRFFWGNLERPPDTYIIQKRSMGNCSATIISKEAIYKTAELYEGQFTNVTRLLKESNDIIDSVETIDEALQLAKDTTHIKRSRICYKAVAF